jgi:hypothetical protein
MTSRVFLVWLFVGLLDGQYPYTNGKSTVDYMLATTRLFYDVQHFIVKPPVEFSDHCLLSVFLEIYAQREVTQRLNSDFGKFQWDNSMSDNYPESCCSKLLW